MREKNTIEQLSIDLDGEEMKRVDRFVSLCRDTDLYGNAFTNQKPLTENDHGRRTRLSGTSGSTGSGEPRLFTLMTTFSYFSLKLFMSSILGLFPSSRVLTRIPEPQNPERCELITPRGLHFPCAWPAHVLAFAHLPGRSQRFYHL